MSPPLDALDEAERELIAAAPAPGAGELMKATLTQSRFSDPAWIFERKLDGVRCLAVKEGGSVRLRSRNDRSQNSRYPEVADAVGAQLGERLALDGEVVAFAGRATSFARLAQRKQHYVPVFYYVFDLLWLDGYDIRRLPLRRRKQLLRGVVRPLGALRLTTHRNGAGEEMFRDACDKGWEGVIAKRADSPYQARRSGDWLKFKCEQGQELVIGGYTAPRGSRTDFGALLLGYFDHGGLRYAGKVGTGFDQITLRELGGRLRSLTVEKPPFVEANAIRERDVRWVRPVLVAQVAFTEWTGHGRLRHPRFLGLREDKPATQVVGEQ